MVFYYFKEFASVDGKQQWPKAWSLWNAIRKPNPIGKYCIYKKGDCPKGLEEGYLFWHDEHNKNINDQGGTLPDGKYDEDTLIHYCCRTDGDKFKPIPLPLISPFYLKAFNSSECQRVQGAIATEEYIRYDNEDTNNQDAHNGSYPYGGGGRNHKIAHCYYESKYLSNCPTTPPLTQQQSTDNKLGLELD